MTALCAECGPPGLALAKRRNRASRQEVGGQVLTHRSASSHPDAIGRQIFR